MPFTFEPDKYHKINNEKYKKKNCVQKKTFNKKIEKKKKEILQFVVQLNNKNSFRSKS